MQAAYIWSSEWTVRLDVSQITMNLKAFQITMALNVSPINHNHIEYFITIIFPKNYSNKNCFGRKLILCTKYSNWTWFGEFPWPLIGQRLLPVMYMFKTLIFAWNHEPSHRPNYTFLHYHVFELIQMEATNIYSFIHTNTNTYICLSISLEYIHWYKRELVPHCKLLRGLRNFG